MRNYDPCTHMIILFNVLVFSGVAGSRGVTIAGVLLCVAALLIVAFAPLLIAKIGGSQ